MPEDFSDTGDLSAVGDASAYWDTALSALLSELESINVQTANIQNATLSVDRPLRFASGTPVFTEQFELGAVLWWVSGAGTGWSATRSTAHYRSKGASMLLRPGRDGAMYAYAYCRDGLLPLVKLGGQVAFTLPADVDRIEFYFSVDSGANYYQPYVKLDYTNSRVQIYNRSLAWVTVVTSWTPDTHDTAFHYLKVVADLSTGYYDTLYLDNLEVDISATQIALFTGGGLGFTNIEAVVYGTVDNNPDVYVDDFCLTEED